MGFENGGGGGDMGGEGEGQEGEVELTIMPLRSSYMIHPGRLTWNLRIHPWKKNITIFRFPVNLPGSII